jgi:transcriptional regulator GlxA family with amidase domain
MQMGLSGTVMRAVWPGRRLGGSGENAIYRWYSRRMPGWRVDLLAYDGCFAAELYGVVDLLTVANAVAGPAGPLFRTRVLSLTGTVALSGGGVLRTDTVQGRRRDELIVPGFECVDPAAVDRHLAGWADEIDYLRGVRGTAVSAICGGAFLLAGAGLLDGHAATTSWLFAPELARRHPAVDVRAADVVVRDGRVATTGAFSAAYDLAMELVHRHGGPRVARITSRVTLVPATRTTQAPYVEEALLPVSAPSFADDVQAWLRAHLAERYDLAALAAAFHVSTRTMLRRFAAGTGGDSPLDYLQRARVAAARRLLETSALSVREITGLVGYADLATFRRLFATEMGVSPADYRRRYAG